MALYLVELTPAQPSKDEATALIETVNSSLTNGAELIETQVSADHKIDRAGNGSRGRVRGHARRTR